MQELKILNTREIKEIKEKLKEQFGFQGKLDYAFLQNEKGKIFIINNDLSRIDYPKLKVDRYGFYLAELKNEEIRLSMEGASLIGYQAQKNIVSLTEDELKKYFGGEDLAKDLGQEKRFVLLQFGKEIIGCAKYKEWKILNFLPKIQRTTELI